MREGHRLVPIAIGTDILHEGERAERERAETKTGNRKGYRGKILKDFDNEAGWKRAGGFIYRIAGTVVPLLPD